MLGRTGRRFGEVRDAVDGEAAIVSNEIDAQSSTASALDEDIDVGWEGLLGVVVFRWVLMVLLAMISFNACPCR